jgi:ATP-binding cassette, subfamily C (CFTR/MRP), member 4
LPVVLGQLLLQFELHRTTPNVTTTTLTPIFSTPTESPADFTTLPNLNYSDDTLVNRFRRNLPENDNKLNLNLPFDNEETNKTANSAKQTFSEINDLLETTTDTVVIAQTAIHEDILEWLRHAWQDITVFIKYAWWDVRWLSSLLILMILITCFLTHHSDLRQRMVGARMRIACCSLIYRKTLKMSKKAAGQTAAGYLVNLLSNDVSRLDYGFIYMHYVWVLPLQSVLICYLLWLDVGLPALIGVIGLLLKTIPVQTGLSRVSSILRMRVATRTDQRVGIMNEIIQGIQVIKMYAWEKPFRVVVAMARKKEVTQIKWASYIRGIYLR